MSETSLAAVQIAACDTSLLPPARELADRLDLPLANPACIPDPRQAAGVLLYLTFDGLKLQEGGRKAPGPTWVDFVSGAVAHRRKFGGGSGQMIAKAVGIQPGVRPRVLDATAGLGKDSFVLATLGCELTLLERSNIIHALLEDGLERGLLDAETAPICQRMTLLQGDALNLMAGRLKDNPPQVVYLDPMFPHTDKSAQVKKEMRLFRQIVGDDQDAPALLASALTLASARVVVKRPRKAPAVEGPAPSYQLQGKSSRYDIYALSKVD